MQSKNIFKDRRFTILKIKDRDFKIPNEYTVEEVERLLELEVKQKDIEKEYVADEYVEKAEQLKGFYKVIFGRLEIMLQHYQPEITADEIRSMVTHTEALDILDWFEQHRYFEASEDVKKKLN